MNSFKTRIPEINSWLLAAVFLFIPITVAPAYILSAAILILCLLEGRWEQKFKILRNEPLVWIFVAYFFVFLLSLAWTQDLAWGQRMVRRQSFFLLFPLYFLVARREHLSRYLAAFLLSVAVCVVLAYYNFFDIHILPQLPEGIRVDKDANDTAPFVDRILYTPVLAFAGYLAIYHLFSKGLGLAAKAACAILFAAVAGNLLFSGGRAGLVGFLALLMVFAFQRFTRRPVVTGLAALSLVAAFLAGGYAGNDYFRSRVDHGIADLQNFKEAPNTSLGQRLTFLMNSWRIYQEHPVIGVGVGDFPAEYDKMNRLHSPDVVTAWNPHNQYMYALTGAGIPGAILLLLVLLYPLLRRSEPDGREHLRKALPVLLLTICLVESYLLRSNTSLMYVLFTAALWCGAGRPRT